MTEIFFDLTVVKVCTGRSSSNLGSVGHILNSLAANSFSKGSHFLLSKGTDHRRFVTKLPVDKV